MTATPAADDGLLRTIKDLVAGAAGGVTQVMVGMCAICGNAFFCCVFLFIRLHREREANGGGGDAGGVGR